jgi:hypothetical protein
LSSQISKHFFILILIIFLCEANGILILIRGIVQDLPLSVTADFQSLIAYTKQSKLNKEPDSEALYTIISLFNMEAAGCE